MAKITWPILIRILNLLTPSSSWAASPPPSSGQFINLSAPSRRYHDKGEEDKGRRKVFSPPPDPTRQQPPSIARSPICMMMMMMTTSTSTRIDQISRVGRSVGKAVAAPTSEKDLMVSIEEEQYAFCISKDNLETAAYIAMYTVWAGKSLLLCSTETAAAPHSINLWPVRFRTSLLPFYSPGGLVVSWCLLLPLPPPSDQRHQPNGIITPSSPPPPPPSKTTRYWIWWLNKGLPLSMEREKAVITNKNKEGGEPRIFTLFALKKSL